MTKIGELERKIKEIEGEIERMLSQQDLERNLSKVHALSEKLSLVKRRLQLFYRVSTEINRLETEVERTKETFFCAPLISVTKPIEGEKFNQGDEVVTEWKSEGLVGSRVRILLFQFLPSGPVLIKTLGRTETSKKRFCWQIPKNFFTGTFQIEVQDETTGVAAFSGKFSIEKK